MKSKKRILIYIVLIVVFGIAIEYQKSLVRERRNAETVSLGKEIEKYGKPVDIEVLQKDNLYEVNRVSLEETKSPYEFRFYLTRDEKNKVKRGQPVLDTKQTNKVIGKVAEVSAYPQISSGLYVGKLRVQKGIKELNAADIAIKVAKNTLSIPVEAMRSTENSDEGEVWIVSDNKVAKQTVRLGLRDRRRIEVLSGLQAGQSIVVNGQRQLDPEDSIRIYKCYNCPQKAEVTTEEVIR